MILENHSLHSGSLACFWGAGSARCWTQASPCKPALPEVATREAKRILKGCCGSTRDTWDDRWNDNWILLYENRETRLPRYYRGTIAPCGDIKRLGWRRSDLLVAVATGVGPQIQPPSCWIGRDKKNTAHFPCETNYKNEQRKKRKLSALHQMFSYF